MGLYIGAENFLYLAKRRVTRGVFRQLRPYEQDRNPLPILGWAGGAFYLARPALGVVNYHWAECEPEDAHLHVIIQPGKSADDLRPLRVVRDEGWRWLLRTKECSDQVGLVWARHGMSSAEQQKLLGVSGAWEVFYDWLARFPVLYLGG